MKRRDWLADGHAGNVEGCPRMHWNVTGAGAEGEEESAV